jgi:hypothetical protein
VGLLSADIEEVLCLVAQRFPPDAVWAVSCGAALALHGLEYRPNDLDIFAGRHDGARLAEALLGLPVVFPYAYCNSTWCLSYWSRFAAGAVELDIVGDFTIRRDGRFLALDAQHPCWRRLERVTVRGIPIPVFALLDLAALYEALPDEQEKLCLIEDALHGLHRA